MVSNPPLRLDLLIVTRSILIIPMSASTAVFNTIVNLRVMIYKSSVFKPPRQEGQNPYLDLLPVGSTSRSNRGIPEPLPC